MSEILTSVSTTPGGREEAGGLMPPRVLPALTGVRGFGALLVLVFHSSFFIYRGFGVSNLSFVESGYLGVELFFILSGFIIAHVHLKDFEAPTWRGTGHFLWLRLARIYPVHLFTLLVKLALLVGVLLLIGKDYFAQSRYSAEAFVANLLLVHSWGLLDSLSWNLPSWSISAEWLAYLCFPVLAVLLLRIRSAALAIVCAGASILGIILAFRAFGLPNTHAFQGYALIRVAGGFSCGAFLYLVYRSRALARLPWGAIATAAFAVLCAQLWVWRSPFAALPTMAVLILALAEGKGPVARAFASRPAVRLGDISYSLYMVHMIVMEVVYTPIKISGLRDMSGWPILAAYAATLAAIALATWLTHRLVERPARVWLRRRVGTRPVAPAAPAMVVRTAKVGGSLGTPQAPLIASGED